MTVSVHHESEVGIPWIDATGSDVPELGARMNGVARQLARWVETARDVGNGKPTYYNRNAYVAPATPYGQIRAAKGAVENDDVIGGVADVTEGLIFQGVKWESEDAETSDYFNQMATKLNLDEFCRQWHREDFSASQSIAALWWGYADFTPKSKTDGGKKSKKTVRLRVPVAWTFLDPMKVVPLKPGPFGQDRLAWRATKGEWAAFNALADDPYGDPVLREFALGPLVVTDVEERDYLSGIGVDPDMLLALNPGSVFRICRTKMSYERFSSVRLKSCFELLDLKQQLIESDRVSLVGAANFILLVRQGTKEQPAEQAEIDNLKQNFHVVAKIPVVVGDHRLQIDIITPPQEFVLKAEKYDVIDRRLMSRALGALTVASSGQRNESTLTIARGVARLLENRRHMLKRVLEEQIARRVIDDPFNAGKLKDEPNFVFTPRNVQLDNDAAMTQAILSLRTYNELSRESTLEYFGFDQATEAMRREFEADGGFDDIFETHVPFSAAAEGVLGDGEKAPAAGTTSGASGQGEPSAVSGARGGRPAGGGKSRQSPQGQGGGRSASGQKTPSK